MATPCASPVEGVGQLYGNKPFEVLGLSPGANRNDILAAHRRLVAMVHPDRGGTSEQVHEANAARDLLLGELPREE